MVASVPRRKRCFEDRRLAAQTSLILLHQQLCSCKPGATVRPPGILQLIIGVGVAVVGWEDKKSCI